MDVFLVPTGASDHELYCEVAEPAPPDTADPPRGIVRRLVNRFRETLAAAEREHRERQSGDAPATASDASFTRRMRDRTMRWMAETIAEQRLLWHLRGCREARLLYPSDMPEAAASSALRAALASDYERHRRWFVVDVLGFIASGALMLVPGPNVLAYYFLFRFVGHYLSMRGARQGMSVTIWRHEPSASLAELRRALALEAPARRARFHEVAERQVQVREVR
jgi:hypothetical protein